jgi:hypothetical protein
MQTRNVRVAAGILAVCLLGPAAAHAQSILTGVSGFSRTGQA